MAEDVQERTVEVQCVLTVKRSIKTTDTLDQVRAVEQAHADAEFQESLPWPENCSVKYEITVKEIGD